MKIFNYKINKLRIKTVKYSNNFQNNNNFRNKFNYFNKKF